MPVKYFVIIALILGVGAGCSRKPGKEECARYGHHLSQLAGHPAIEAALKSADGKAAVTAHCMELKKSQVECATDAASLSDATTCETKKGSFFEL